VRIYVFSVLITFDVAARGGAAGGHPDGTRTRCVAQACHRQYFPGILSRDEQPRPAPAVHARLSVALNDGEAEAFFAPGRRLAIWADAIVGTTIYGDGFVGYGVIESHKSPAPPVAGAGRIQRSAARPPQPTPMAGAVHRPAGHRGTVPWPCLGTDASLAGRPR
jgi:hypothetical protein